MKYETFGAFLVSVALPALAYPTGSTIAEADAGTAIEQRDEGADVERRDPATLWRGPNRPPTWPVRPPFILDAIRPLPKVASRSDGADVERREPKRGKGKGNGQQPAGPGKVETVTNVLNTAFPWVDMVNQQQQGKRSEAAEVERREPKRGKGKGNNQQPGGPGKVETVTNVLNTAFPWVDMVNQQQQGKRSEAGIEARSPKRVKGKGNNNNNQGPGKVETVTNVLNTAFPWVDMVNQQQQQQGKRSEAGIEERSPKRVKGKGNNNQGPGKVDTVTNVLNTAFPWVDMINQQQQQPKQKRSEAGIEERAPKRSKGKGGNNNNNQGPGKVETVTNVLNTAFPWVDMVNQQQQQQQPKQKRSEAGIEERSPKRSKGKGGNNNNQGPGKVETVTNVLNTAFPWVDMINQQQQPKQKRSEVPSGEELADMLEAAAAGYLDEKAEQVVRRAVVAAMLA